VREGEATEAEQEELALYAEGDPAVALLSRRADEERTLGGTWLSRVAADRRIEAAERSPVVVAERGLGMALLIGGLVGVFFVPALGLAAAAGAGILGFSVLRVRLRTAMDDPYKDIEK
jgi:hypothetical protein